MSQSSVEEQIRELEAAGVPVRKGTRMSHRDDTVKTPTQFGSDIWFSRWSRNVFKNYPIVSQALGIRFLADAAKGLPAFVVGVGPSLDADIKQLKSVKGRALIIAVDAALRPLLANGITPDLVVSFDCKEDQNRLWRDLPPGVNVPGLLNSCTATDTIKTWPGPVLFFNQYHEADELCKRILPDVLPNLGQMPSGGTVGNMALEAAHAMGCDPICAVGFDFCLQPSPADVVAYRYRAQDYRWVPQGVDFDPGWQPTEIKELYDNDERVARSFKVKGENGKEFTSDPELTFYLESFRHIMAHFKVPIVNCTPNGMIPQESFGEDVNAPTVYPAMSVAQAIETYCKHEYQGGRTILPYLAKIAPDPRGNP